MTLVQTLVAIMVAASPPERATPPPGWSETTEQRLERYTEIATDAEAVGKTQRWSTLIIATAFHESGFRIDVDKGPCAKGWCDGGASSCMSVPSRAFRAKICLRIVASASRRVFV